MKLDLKQIFDIPGESTEFDYAMPMAEYELYGNRPFITPVLIKGRICNAAGVVNLSYSVDFTLRLPCDRCLDVFDREYHYSFEEILVQEESAEHDEYIVAEGGVLDVDELCMSDILLSLPAKQLCREDCKGLCPHCGVNRNHESCACVKSEVDPRLAALGELLQ